MANRAFERGKEQNLTLYGKLKATISELWSESLENDKIYVTN